MATRAQRKHVREIAEARRDLTRKHAFRIGPYIDAWQAEGLSQRAIADELNACGAVTPGEFRDEPYAPVVTKTWNQTQVARLLRDMADAREKMAWHAKRKGGGTGVWRGGAGLFARPELAPLPAKNAVKPGPYGPVPRRYRGQSLHDYLATLDAHAWLTWTARWEAMSEAEKEAYRAEEEARRARVVAAEAEQTAKYGRPLEEDEWAIELIHGEEAVRVAIAEKAARDEQERIRFAPIAAAMRKSAQNHRLEEAARETASIGPQQPSPHVIQPEVRKRRHVDVAPAHPTPAGTVRLRLSRAKPTDTPSDP